MYTNMENDNIPMEESTSDLDESQEIDDTQENEETPASSATVQRSLKSFFLPKEKVEVSPVEQVQGDISRILLMLESLTIPEKQQRQSVDVNINHDVTAVITASNLLEVKHPDIIADSLEDGCKITCHTCQQFQFAQQKKDV